MSNIDAKLLTPQVPKRLLDSRNRQSRDPLSSKGANVIERAENKAAALIELETDDKMLKARDHLSQHLQSTPVRHIAHPLANETGVRLQKYANTVYRLHVVPSR